MIGIEKPHQTDPVIPDARQALKRTLVPGEVLKSSDACSPSKISDVNECFSFLPRPYFSRSWPRFDNWSSLLRFAEDFWTWCRSGLMLVACAAPSPNSIRPTFITVARNPQDGAARVQVDGVWRQS